jgi:hypothetical protein
LLVGIIFTISNISVYLDLLLVYVKIKTYGNSKIIEEMNKNLPRMNESKDKQKR